jgi:RNA-directed DNA polymerase
MKSYNHLWEKFISEDNIKLAINASSLGKRDRRDVKEYYEHPELFIAAIKSYAENFKNCPHKPKEINDGISRKRRIIIVPWYKEQVVHHMLVNCLKPIFLKGMYEHSYGSIPDKGVHLAKKRIESWIKHDPKNMKYYLKMDIRKYFNSVPHDILKHRLKELIHDEKFLKVLYEVIDVVDVGIPIGFYTSQWIANWYLSGLDHYIKEELEATHYVRYMDDMVIYGANKRKLHKIRQAIQVYLETKLGLALKNNWQVERFSFVNKEAKDKGRDLDFMGFRFFRNRTILRKSILLKATRKALRIKKKGNATIHDCRQMLSYKGWFDCTDTYEAYRQRIKPYVNFRILRKKVGRYDRIRRKNVVQK